MSLYFPDLHESPAISRAFGVQDLAVEANQVKG